MSSDKGKPLSSESHENNPDDQDLVSHSSDGEARSILPLQEDVQSRALQTAELEEDEPLVLRDTAEPDVRSVSTSEQPHRTPRLRRLPPIDISEVPSVLYQPTSTDLIDFSKADERPALPVYDHLSTSVFIRLSSARLADLMETPISFSEKRIEDFTEKYSESLESYNTFLSERLSYVQSSTSMVIIDALRNLEKNLPTVSTSRNLSKIFFDKDRQLDEWIGSIVRVPHVLREEVEEHRISADAQNLSNTLELDDLFLEYLQALQGPLVKHLFLLEIHRILIETLQVILDSNDHQLRQRRGKAIITLMEAAIQFPCNSKPSDLKLTIKSVFDIKGNSDEMRNEKERILRDLFLSIFSESTDIPGLESQLVNNFTTIILSSASDQIFEEVDQNLLDETKQDYEKVQTQVQKLEDLYIERSESLYVTYKVAINAFFELLQTERARQVPTFSHRSDLMPNTQDQTSQIGTYYPLASPRSSVINTDKYYSFAEFFAPEIKGNSSTSLLSRVPLHTPQVVDGLTDREIDDYRLFMSQVLPGGDTMSFLHERYYFENLLLDISQNTEKYGELLNFDEVLSNPVVNGSSLYIQNSSISTVNRLYPQEERERIRRIFQLMDIIPKRGMTDIYETDEEYYDALSVYDAVVCRIIPSPEQVKSEDKLPSGFLDSQTLGELCYRVHRALANPCNKTITNIVSQLLPFATGEHIFVSEEQSPSLLSERFLQIAAYINATHNQGSHASTVATFFYYLSKYPQSWWTTTNTRFQRIKSRAQLPRRESPTHEQIRRGNLNWAFMRSDIEELKADEEKYEVALTKLRPIFYLRRVVQSEGVNSLLNYADGIREWNRYAEFQTVGPSEHLIVELQNRIRRSGLIVLTWNSKSEPVLKHYPFVPYHPQ